MKIIKSKQIYQIFSKNPQKEVPKIKIQIDYREQNSYVPAELEKLGFKIELKELKVGDYIIKETVIERKTVNDFISSMKNKRLIRQLEELQQYKNRLLIIEGIEEQELYSEKLKTGIHPNAIRGFLLSILLKYKVPIIYTKDFKDTAKFILVLAKKQDKEISYLATKKATSKNEQMQFILQGFPGIGPSSAKKLLKDFKTIRNIANASQEELKSSIGKKGEIIKNLIGSDYS